MKKFGDPKNDTGPWLDRELKKGEDRMKALIKEKLKGEEDERQDGE